MLFRTASLLFAAAVLAPANEPRSADEIINHAATQAASAHQAVWVIFHASWCGWCRKLDSFIESAEVKPIIEKYFVIARIDVQETKEKNDLNTPGGDDLMKRLGGPAGLPFFAFMDARGAMLVNSMRPGDNGKKPENIGHPAQPEEVDWFLVMLHKAVPQMTSEESATLERWLRNQKR